MSIQTHIIRILRNLLYWLHQKTEQKFRQANRLLLRKVTADPDHLKEATTITDRRTNDDWKRLQPVWILSTGRTGTNTMTELFRLSPKTDAFHEPSPELFRFSYDYYMNHIDRAQALTILMYLRDEIVFRSHRDGLIYIETNNRVTYLAGLLLELYPESRFLHVCRNPYDFIRSGMRRKYYHGHMRDSTRITPKTSDPYFGEWDSFSAIEKTAWNWTVVNDYCISFMEQLPDQQKMSLASEDFFEANTSLLNRLFDFIGLSEYHPRPADIRRVMGVKHNAQKRGTFSKPGEWTREQTAGVNRIIAPVADRLSYPLLGHQRSMRNLHSE